MDSHLHLHLKNSYEVLAPMSYYLVFFGRTVGFWITVFLQSDKKKRYKAIWIGKKEVKLSLYSDGMIIYIEIPM